MKKYIFLLLLLLFSLVNYSQTNKKNIDLSFDIGLKYMLFDSYSGPIMGLSLNFDNKFQVNLRNDITLLVGKKLYKVDSSGTPYYLDEHIIKNYSTLNYIEVAYNLSKPQKNELYLGLGLGWICHNEALNYRLNGDYGYPVITSSINYKVKWLIIEARSDFNLSKNPKHKYNHLMPFSLGIIYKFNPLKEDD
ncbi:MAG: hypothetical protein U9R42_14485 [Bacteroidota bacterium]|nr:hypothetical protein [Bacteroidota bacterium]